MEGPVDGAGESLQNIPGIDRVEPTGPNGLHVTFGPGYDLVSDVASHLVSKGHRLRRLEPQSMDLEEAYLRLTSREEA
jgi:hypothetical protein